MLFKDDNGAVFEEVDVKELSDVQPQDLVIRPIVKAEPKWEVVLGGSEYDKLTIQITLPPPTEPAQAQLIKAAIEAIMQSIFEGQRKAYDADRAITKARHSIKGDK